MSSLADALPQEITRVRQLQDQFKELRALPNVIVEPQIQMMETSIQNAIKACASGDVLDMLRALEDMKEWKE